MKITASHLNRPRRMFIRLLVFLAGTTIASAGGACVLFHQYDKATRERDSVRDEFAAVFQRMDSLYTAALRQRMRNRPISYVEWDELLKTAKHCEDFAARDAGRLQLRFALARAFELKGRLFAEVGAVKMAEREFREAQALFGKLVAENPQVENQLALASVDNRLANLFADMGRISEARDEVQKVITLSKGITIGPGMLFELAIACDNLAILAQTAGDARGAELHMRRGLSRWQELAGRDTKANVPLEHWVDAQQSLVGLLWRANRFAEAETVCRESLALIATIEENCRIHPKKKMELRHIIARDLAEANLRSVQSSTASFATSPNTRSKTGWRWSPLAERNGKTINSSILDRGALSAEFEPHDALLLAFSWNKPDMNKADLLNAFTSIVKETHQHIQLVILVPDTLAQQHIASRLRQTDIPLERIRFIQVPTDTIWLRDYGPFVIQCNNRQYKLVNAAYSDNRLLDDNVPAGLGQLLRMEIVRTSIHLTGGNLLCNGNGLCIATNTLLKRNAEAGHSEKHVIATIRRLFGAKTVVFLERLDGEITGDVDWFAAFTSPDTVVVGDYEGRDPENAAILNRNAERLKGIMTSSGPLKVVRIPMPPGGGDFFGGTYTNVVFANKVLLVPTWSDQLTEVRALHLYRKLLPGWKIIGVDATAIRRGQGAFRCMTMPMCRIPDPQWPAATMPSIPNKSKTG